MEPRPCTYILEEGKSTEGQYLSPCNTRRDNSDGGDRPGYRIHPGMEPTAELSTSLALNILGGYLVGSMPAANADAGS